jgi:hypothetical protein
MLPKAGDGSDRIPLQQRGGKGVGVLRVAQVVEQLGVGRVLALAASSAMAI